MSTLCVAKKHVCLASDGIKSPEDEKETAAGVERPLVRITNISTFTIKLYRFMILVRMGIFVLFFKWRISTALATTSSGAGDDTSGVVGAMSTASVAGELWFALMWVLDQLPRMNPVRRAVDVAALEEPRLPAVDVFVTTADPDKEPPLATANTVLSILAADYPADRLTCYVSDDAGAPLTRDAIAEAARFAALWVPFCRKHGVEPRNPEAYFSGSGGGDDDGNKQLARVIRRGEYKGMAWPELARDRRRVRREYEELRLRIDALQAADIRRRRQWARGTVQDHAGVVQVIIGSGLRVNDDDLRRLPALVYVRREKRPGRAHHGKAGALNALLRASAALSDAPFVLNLDCDHYVNNPLALRAGVCNVLDRAAGGDDVAFVQFPQRFDGVDPGDRYANHNRVFFDCTQPGLDGVQGPIYVGTGCLFRRAALYGADPPRWRPHDDAKDSSPLMTKTNHRPERSSLHDEEAVAAATSVVSCGYDEHSAAWGRDVGWAYGTVTEDVATGFRMHRRGWRSAYCATAPDAFRGTAPLNLTDRLQQVLRWAAGSLEILLSRDSALLAGGGRRLHPLQRAAYLNTTLYPLTALFLLLYCLFPAVPLLVTGDAAVRAAVDRPPVPALLAFLAALMLTMAAVAALEVRWSGITLGDWWRNEQFWMVSATSAYLAAVAQVALKVAARRNEISFKLTSKRHASAADGGRGKDSSRFAELYAVRWTAMMVPPAVVLAVNVASMVVMIEDGGSGRVRNGGATALAVAFNAWVLVHLHPFALGLMGRWSKAFSPLLLLIALYTVRLLCFVVRPEF